jgi:parallel beta-helix repeat protein
MKKLTSVFLFACFISVTASSSELRVCSYCPFTTISDALAEALNGDTIKVIWEGSEQSSTYPEELSIEKEVTLTSDQNPVGDDYDSCPIITQTLTGNHNIITITAENVTISRLRIRAQPLPGSGDDDPTDMARQAGIKISKGNCAIRKCQIQGCRVGILVDEVLDNQIDQCEIGKLKYIDEWFPPGESASHPGNFFGIVQIEPARISSEYPAGSYRGNEISNCHISRNRFYGVVLRGGSMATVKNNLIVWNGTGTPLTGNHYGDGGILCLFTSDEMTATDVLVSSPLLMSNDIYGNDGYQVCVITDNKDLKPTDIKNAPLIMSNIIGPNPFIDPEMTPGARPYLVSCSSESESAQAYPQYGSAPVMAYNNLFRPAGDRYFLNPAQIPTQTPTYSGPASTPSPTPTASTPTETPVPTTTGITPSWFWTNTPTGTRPPTRTPMPWYTFIQTPTPTDTPVTPIPTCYQFKEYAMGVDSWSILNNLDNPEFVGGTDVSDFDFHLLDSINPTPGATPSPRSACFNRGGLNLDPGITRDDEYPDVDRVDAGMHFRSVVPCVSRLAIGSSQTSFTLEWMQPTHYADGRLFSDLIGNILSYGEYDSQSGEIVVIRSKFLDPCSSCVINVVPPGYTHAGISVYNARGAQSRIVWVALPTGSQLNP